MSQLVDGLSRGYRLHSREYSRVDFNTSDQNVWHQTIRERVKANDQDFIVPLSFWSANINVKTSEQHVIETILSNGTIKSVYSETEHHRYDLDNCWTKVRAVFDYGLFVNTLKEHILEGRAVRVVIDGLSSVDIPAVTVTDSEVIAALADYLTPIPGSLSSNSRVVFTLFSTSKMKSECHKVFCGSQIDNTTTTGPHDVNIQWFVSTRSHDKIFATDHNGHILMGSNQTIFEAYNDGKDFRICVNYQNQDSGALVWMCTGMTIVYYFKGGLLVQSESFSRALIDKDGRLTGMSGNSSCDRSVWLFSSQGWAHEMVYNKGFVDPSDNPRNVNVISMTWFA